MIFVTVGGGLFYKFDRLVSIMDEIAQSFAGDIFIQRGCSDFVPRFSKGIDFLDFSQMMNKFKTADLIVGHAGAGTILLARYFRKPLIIMPRLKENNEIFDNHQVELARKASQSLGMLRAENKEQVIMAIRKITQENNKFADYESGEKEKVVVFIKDTLSAWSRDAGK